jgi:glycosyltransferase involved in cell wall biosynthesis
VRVAYDEQVFLFQKQGGISRYFANLIADLGRESYPGVDVSIPFRHVWNDYASADLEEFGVSMGPKALAPYPLIAASFLRPRRREPVDLIHHTFYHSRYLRDYPGAKKVVTLYDMIPERFPDAVSGKVHMAKAEYYQRADLLIAISESTKRDAIEAYGEPNCPIQVVPLGVSNRFADGGPPAPGLPAEYLLYVGQRGGYKDFDLLLRAFAQIAPSYPDLSLVAVGGGEFSASERRRIKELRLEGRVVQDYVDDEHLPGTYAGSRLFVMPSRYEGFGIPILEAMAAGAPVIAANASSFPEVGGEAIRYFTPGDSDDLVSNLEALLDSEIDREHLSVLGRTRAKDFTWSRTAEMTAAAYTSLTTA